MKFSKSRFLLTLALIAADCVMLGGAYAVSIWFYTYLQKLHFGLMQPYLESLSIMLSAHALLFLLLGMHRVMWNHASIFDLVRLITNCLLSSLAGYFALRITVGGFTSPILGVCAFALFSCGAAFLRLYPKIFAEFREHLAKNHSDSKSIPIIIVGAGDTADNLLKDISSRVGKYRVVGLLDDNESKMGLSIRGTRVLGKVSDALRVAKETAAKEIIIAIPSATTEQRRRLIKECSLTGLPVRMADGVLSFGEATAAKFHSLNTSDLLGRGEQTLADKTTAEFITGKRIMVTGGGGSIGSELCRQIMKCRPQKLIIFDIYENNAYDIHQELLVNFDDFAKDTVEVYVGSVQDKSRLDYVFGKTKPQVIFHAAAYKHVPLMEECPRLAIENNVFGTYNVSGMAVAHGAEKFIMISTDKAVSPTNVMGASKRIAEAVIHTRERGGTVFSAVRFGNVLGSNGSVVPLFKRQIEAGGPVTVTHPDIIRFFMTIPEAVGLVLTAGAKAQGGETFLLDMGEPVKIAELARSMIEMAGLVPDKDIEIKYSGLRPGEKLYEELLVDGEKVKKTPDNKIYIASDERPADITADGIVEKLKQTLTSADKLRDTIKEIVPDYVYTPNN
ncbi:MAG: polysaccharide biosynthesis protein [Oscillospiraceae bacterium]|jgi:FlaA1/EpsC-like NDP-sugar epimerase|nr:polysaccharide biosynthesis protein [Oscillospiraceae bacterium]